MRQDDVFCAASSARVAATPEVLEAVEGIVYPSASGGHGAIYHQRQRYAKGFDELLRYLPQAQPVVLNRECLFGMLQSCRWPVLEYPDIGDKFGYRFFLVL